MLSKQKRTRLINIIQTFRVEISNTKRDEGTSRSLEIGDIWVFQHHEGEAWSFEYHECPNSIVLIGDDLALIDADGGNEAAWEIMEELFFKFHKSHQNMLGEWKTAKAVFEQFIKNLAKKDEGYIYFLQKMGVDCICKIGRSKYYPKRINKLEVKLPFDVDPLLVCYSSEHKRSEKLLHSFFSNKRLNGEWFALTAEDLILLDMPGFCCNMLLERIVIDNRKNR